jgi:hypothetical protein
MSETTTITGRPISLSSRIDDRLFGLLFERRDSVPIPTYFRPMKPQKINRHPRPFVGRHPVGSGCANHVVTRRVFCLVVTFDLCTHPLHRPESDNTDGDGQRPISGSRRRKPHNLSLFTFNRYRPRSELERIFIRNCIRRRAGLSSEAPFRMGSMYRRRRLKCNPSREGIG